MRRRVAKTLDRTADFKPFGAVHLLRHDQVAEIDFVPATREAHRQRPDLRVLRAQQRNDPRGFAAIFVAVGDQQDPTLPPLADLSDRRLQRRLDIGLFAVQPRCEIRLRQIPARQKLPLRRSTEQEQSGARFGIFRALSRLDNLARFFSPFLAHAAREIDAQHHVQCVGCLEDSRVDDGENQRRAGQRPRRQRSERRATPQSEDPLDDEQNQYDNEQRRPEGNSRFRRLAAFLAFFTGSHRAQLHAWCDLRFRLVEEIDRELTSPIGALETIKAGFGGIGEYKRTRDGLEVFFPARGSGDF